jgi:hypothetical protein
MAAPTLEQFKAKFPVFSEAGDTVLQAQLDAAERYWDESAMGEELYFEAVAYQAADLLSKQPFGTQMALNTDDEENVFQRHLEKEIYPRVARRMMLTGTDLD